MYINKEIIASNVVEGICRFFYLRNKIANQSARVLVPI